MCRHKRNVFSPRNCCMSQTSCCYRSAQLKLYIDCEFEVSIKSTYKVQVIRIKFSTISKISNTSQMLIFPCLSIHYTSTREDRNRNDIWKYIGCNYNNFFNSLRNMVQIKLIIPYIYVKNSNYVVKH
jgi:hypothetical protein